MKVMRRAASAAALTLGLVAPDALAQRGQGPGPDTPRLLVAVFQSSDRQLGVQVADAIRSRVPNVVNIRQLYVIPKNDITTYLESSGYRPDSSLGLTDLKELAKLLRADEVLAGVATRTEDGIRVEPRLMLSRDPSIAQPLPAVDARNPNDAARQVERALQDARKQLPDNQDCENAIRDQQYDKAIAAANAGMQKYAQATIARLCLASVYQVQKKWDDVLRVTDEIRRLDPKNTFALRIAFGAYQEKNDPENAVRALMALMALEPQNPNLQQQVIAELAKLGRPEVAIPLVDTLIAQNPGDPTLLRQKWLLLLSAAASADSGERASLFDKAVVAGEEMVKADTLLADSTYWGRQIAAASGSNTPQRAAEFASRAVQKYPTSAEFWSLKGNAERKAGQLQMADASFRRALEIDPKLPNGNLFLAQINLDMGRIDTAMAIADRAVRAGEDAKTWGAFLLLPTQSLWKVADSAKTRDAYLRVLAVAQKSDSLSQSETAAFFIGVSSFSIAIDAIQAAQKPKSCELAKLAQEMFLLAQTNMPRGGRIEPNTARQVLQYTSQYAPTADQMVKAYCK